MPNTDIPLVTQQMRTILNEADCLYPLEDVQAAISNMASQITHQLSDKTPLVLVVMNGGLVFSGQLLTQLNFPLQVNYLQVSRYRDETQGGQLEWKVRPSESLVGRTILVVDDILDEGHTLKAILDHCRQSGADDVYSAVLTDKLHDRKVFSGFKADFEGLKVVDRFVFGFGMDYQGYWRNAPGIYAIKGL